ncbi:MAG TPA: hypothetical protein VEA16_10725 [Vicinamibacterales bacterium]|nr:hypothetical protein [Vicinamibacterales bacterium]
MQSHRPSDGFLKRAVALGGAIIMLTSGCGGSAEAPASPSISAPLPGGPGAAVSVRWVGTSPDGMVVEREPQDQCPAEFDLELNLMTIGTTVTGSATTRLRRVEAAGPCNDVLGQVANWSVTGRVESNNISFDLGNTLSHRFAGTIAGTRMTGTFEIIQFPQSGRFAVTRQ